MPVAKLTTLRNVISTRKPVRFSERCGVSRAENSLGGSSAGSKSLLAVIAYQYTRIMAKSIRSQRAKKPAVRSAARQPAKKPAKPPPKKSAKKLAKPKPWTAAEV